MILMGFLRSRRSSHQLLPEHRFIRTIRSPIHTVWDKKNKRYAVSSAIFKPRQNEALSGDLEQLLLEDGLHAVLMQPSVPDDVGSIAIRIADLRHNGVEVIHVPVPKNWYHGGATGPLSERKNELKDKCEEIVAINQDKAAEYHEERRTKSQAA